MRLGVWDIRDDGSTTSSWPDRFQFLFDGVRTGGFNEYGELRSDAAKSNTVAARFHGHKTGGTADSTGNILEVREARNLGDVLLGVSRSGITMLRNLSMGGSKVTDLGTPTADTDAASKGYVDSVIAPAVEPRYLFDRFFDFFSAVGSDGCTAANSGSGAGTSVFAAPDHTRFGIVRSTTGSTATGRTAVASAGGALLFHASTSWTFRAQARVAPTLSNATDRFQFLIGFLGTFTSATQVDSVYFLYDEGGVSPGSTASPNWQIVVASNSVLRYTVTSVPVDTEWHEFAVVVVGTVGTFLLDGVEVGTFSDLPNGSNRNTGFGWALLKSAGTTARTADVDFMHVRGTIPDRPRLGGL